MFTFWQAMWNMKSGDVMCINSGKHCGKHRKPLEFGDGECINAANQFGTLQQTVEMTINTSNQC